MTADESIQPSGVPVHLIKLGARIVKAGKQALMRLECLVSRYTDRVRRLCVCVYGRGYHVNEEGMGTKHSMALFASMSFSFSGFFFLCPFSLLLLLHLLLSSPVLPTIPP